MHLRRGHYIGVAPVTDDLANACVVTDDRARLARPREVLHTTLMADPLLRERFARAACVSEIVCVGPLAVDSRRCGTDGLLLAGDAAGFVDPMTGDGLWFALRGGVLAASAVLGAFERSPGSTFHWLAVARRREFAVKQRVNLLLRRLVASESGLAVGELTARAFPCVVRALIQFAADLPRRPARIS
jgi:flavin-dependent dehydrogenase